LITIWRSISEVFDVGKLFSVRHPMQWNSGAFAGPGKPIW